MNFIERVLVEQREELGLEAAGLGTDLETALLTPRFVTSRHVIGLVYARGERRPRVVVKMPRQPGDKGGIEREAELLQRLHSLLGPHRLRVPAILGMVECDGQTLLVESVVEGTPLRHRRVRRHFAAALAAGISFITALPVTRPAEDNADWYRSLVAGPLTRLEQVVPRGGETVELCARTHALLAPLRSVPLPAVFEHGDLSHPNLLLGGRAAGLGVVDWERSTVDGLPGHDLVFFLQFLGEAVQSAFAWPAQAAVFDRAFVGSAAWAVPVLRDHLRDRGVDPALWGPLVLASWARTAATLVTRLVPGDGDGPLSPALEAAVVSHRDMLLWRRAVDAAERGELVGPPAVDRGRTGG